MLLEHNLAPEFGEGMETLDLVRIGADGSPHWTRIWPTPEENPRHAGLELWMADLWAPDRQQAGERVRLVRRRGRLIVAKGDGRKPGQQVTEPPARRARLGD